LGLNFTPAGDGTVIPNQTNEARIVVRLLPYTLAPRFRGWATTAAAVGATLTAARELADLPSIHRDTAMPDPSGVFVSVRLRPDERHRDELGGLLETASRVVLDGAGVAGASFQVSKGSHGLPMYRVQLDQLAREYIVPVLRVTAGILEAGEFLGRARCQIDLLELGETMSIWDQHGDAPPWVPVGADLSLPAARDDIDAIALRATYAYGRSVGLHAWDPPVGG
jgi:hypothetical protein